VPVKPRIRRKSSRTLLQSPQLRPRLRAMKKPPRYDDNYSSPLSRIPNNEGDVCVCVRSDKSKAKQSRAKQKLRRRPKPNAHQITKNAVYIRKIIEQY